MNLKEGRRPTLEVGVLGRVNPELFFTSAGLMFSPPPPPAGAAVEEYREVFMGEREASEVDPANTIDTTPLLGVPFELPPTGGIDGGGIMDVD